MSKVSEFKKLAEELTFDSNIASISPSGGLELSECHIAEDMAQQFIEWLVNVYGTKTTSQKKGK